MITKIVYEMFDYSEFLKNNEHSESIKYYTKILEIINPLYPKLLMVEDAVRKRKMEQSENIYHLENKSQSNYVVNYLAIPG